MPKKLTSDEFRRMLDNPEVPDEEIAKYLKKKMDGGGPFSPQFEPDPGLVEPDRFESALTVGNQVSRTRRRAKFKLRTAFGTRLPVIVSEGDSWFQFPFIIKDVIDHLDDDYLVWSCGAAGDTAENMIFDNPEYMEAIEEQAERVSALLLSAAGNDVIGEDENGEPVLLKLLHRRTASRDTANELINKSALGRVLDKLRDAYAEVFQRVRADRRFERLPIIIHGYDYALPFPNGANDRRDPFWAEDDKWLGGPMKQKGISEPAIRREIVEILIQQLYDVLSDVAANDEHVHVVDVRGTLTSTRDWADEIHGTSDGFARVAAKFRKVLNQVVEPREEVAFHEDADVAGLSAPAAEPDLTLEAEPPPFLIERVKGKKLDPSRLGFRNMDKFASGFRRASERIALRAQPEVAIEEDDSVPFRFLLRGAERGRAVCKLEASGTNFRGERGRWSGTGFLIAPNVVLTNHHVINSEHVASRSRAVFRFQETDAGEMAPTSVFSLNPDRLFISSPFDDLDYCFVWVEGTPSEEFGTIEFWRGSFMAATDTRANIIHHPGGDPKRASLEKNKIIDLGLNEVLVHYSSDTEPGSSGSPVMNEDWRLFALHHASSGRLSPSLKKLVAEAGYPNTEVLNEGIKTSAIAIDIGHRANHGPNQGMARQVSEHINGTDSRTGFFGTLGRATKGKDGLEVVVDTYQGAPDDVDIAFWNIEWFNRNYQQKLDDVARIVADLNLDIWAFEETSPKATEALVNKMRHDFDLEFDFAASEPGASDNKQTTTVIWNRLTVAGERLEWSPEIDRILRLRSDDPDADRFEAVEGKIFNRYPALFRFEALNRDRGRSAFNFNLIPVHLKAMAEGAKRRRMASKVLATAIAIARRDGIDEEDWIIGGDFNAELSTGQFDALKGAGFEPMSAEDERGGAITYLGRRYRSLIDSIFLSPGLSRGVSADDFMIIAPDREDPGFTRRVSDHRPVMVRLSLSETRSGDEGRPPRPTPGDDSTANEQMLSEFLKELEADPPSVLEDLAGLLRRR